MKSPSEGEGLTSEQYCYLRGITPNNFYSVRTAKKINKVTKVTKVDQNSKITHLCGRQPILQCR